MMFFAITATFPVFYHLQRDDSYGFEVRVAGEVHTYPCEFQGEISFSYIDGRDDWSDMFFLFRNRG